MLTLSVSGNILSYVIHNPSDRTLYLLNNGDLCLGLFIDENKRRYSGPGTRSHLSLQNHRKRKIAKYWGINSLQGTIDMGWLPMSITLEYIFSSSNEHENPYRENGYDDYYIGIGKNTDSLRPYSMSEPYRIWINNNG